jgi:hypothetical protein
MDIDKFNWEQHGDGSWTGVWYKTTVPGIASRMVQELKVQGRNETRVFQKLAYNVGVDDHVTYWDKEKAIVLRFNVRQT